MSSSSRATGQFQNKKMVQIEKDIQDGKLLPRDALLAAAANGWPLVIDRLADRVPEQNVKDNAFMQAFINGHGDCAALLRQHYGAAGLYNAKLITPERQRVIAAQVKSTIEGIEGLDPKKGLVLKNKDKILDNIAFIVNAYTEVLDKSMPEMMQDDSEEEGHLYLKEFIAQLAKKGFSKEVAVAIFDVNSASKLDNVSEKIYSDIVGQSNEEIIKKLLSVYYENEVTRHSLYVSDYNAPPLARFQLAAIKIGEILKLDASVESESKSESESWRQCAYAFTVATSYLA
jgi:hypothetical protein